MVNIVPHVGSLFIDTISITLDIPTSHQSQVLAICNALGSNYGVYPKFSPVYGFSVRLILDDHYGNPSPLIIQCSPVLKNVRYTRLEWHPSKVDASVVKSILNSILPNGFDSLLNGTITRIDPAIDIKYAKPEHLNIHYPNVQVSRIYLKSGKIQGLYLGTAQSNRQFVLYDKNVQLAEKSYGTPFKYPILPYDSSRLEARVRMDLGFPALLMLDNPFKKMTVSLTAKPKPFAQDDEYRLFKRLCMYEGVTQAIKQISDKSKRNKFLSRLISEELNGFWEPEKIWSGLPIALIQAGFPISKLMSEAC